MLTQYFLFSSSPISILVGEGGLLSPFSPSFFASTLCLSMTPNKERKNIRRILYEWDSCSTHGHTHPVRDTEHCRSIDVDRSLLIFGPLTDCTMYTSRCPGRAATCKISQRVRVQDTVSDRLPSFSLSVPFLLLFCISACFCLHVRM